jgi:hypothetical protein
MRARLNALCPGELFGELSLFPRVGNGLMPEELAAETLAGRQLLALYEVIQLPGAESQARGQLFLGELSFCRHVTSNNYESRVATGTF